MEVLLVKNQVLSQLIRKLIIMLRMIVRNKNQLRKENMLEKSIILKVY